jgi:hypothetical protein
MEARQHGYLSVAEYLLIEETSAVRHEYIGAARCRPRLERANVALTLRQHESFGVPQFVTFGDSPRDRPSQYW